MMNNFSQLSAESAEHRMAQMSSEEMTEANTFFDELATKLDSDVPIVTPEGLAVNRASWALLDSIHNEIVPKIEAKRETEAFLETI